MKFGRPVWHGNKPFENTFKTAQESGFDYIEFSLDFPYPENFSENEIKLLKSLKKKYGLDLAFHAPWGDVSIAHPREEISNASLKVFEKCIKFAENMDSLYFNFHNSIKVPTLKFEDVKNKAYKKALESMSELAKSSEVILTLENNSFLEFFGKTEDFEHINEKLKICLDVGHVAACSWRGKTDFKKDLEEWIKKFKNKIHVVHLHDFKGDAKTYEDHLTIGSGNLDFNFISKAIKLIKCNYVNIELYKFNSDPIIDFKSNLKLVKELLNP